MKLFIGLLPFALSSLVAAWIQTGGQEVLDGSTLKVPGDSPLEFCDGDISKDLLKVEHVNLIPNPPVRGGELSIDAAGKFTVTVEKGAFVHLTVKFAKYITIVNTKVDLCDQMENVDKECPLEEGYMRVIKDVKLPDEIPPGEYTVEADVYTVDEKRLTCIKAKVHFQ